MDRSKNERNAGNELVDEGRSFACARYDSRPLEYAKDPSGRAESERRRSAWPGIRFEESEKRQLRSNPRSAQPFEIPLENLI
jgi:hypothetical protein